MQVPLKPQWQPWQCVDERTPPSYPAGRWSRTPMTASVQNPTLMQQYHDYLEITYPERYSRSFVFPETFLNNNSEEIGRRAEEKVFNVLKNLQEPGLFTVHSKKFCLIRAGEVDFVIISQRRGLILLEVKSQAKIRAYNMATRQLEKALEAFKRKIKEMKENVSVRYAVVMPNVSRCRQREFAPEMCYSEDLRSSEAFMNWLDKYMPSLEGLKESCYDKLISVCLKPFTDRGVDRIFKKLIRLTSGQAALLDGIPDEFYICGPAGSGKTEVLITKACDWSLAEQKKLVVVFNNPLRDYLKRRLQGVNKLEIYTFYGLLWRILGIAPSTENFQMSLEDVIKRATEVAKRDNFKFESIFVDEAQTLEGNQWEELINVLHVKGERHLKWIFFDGNQAVGFSRPPKAGNKIYHLRKVIRNTIKIFEFSLPFYRSEREAIVEHKIVGPDVECKFLPSTEIVHGGLSLLTLLEQYTRELLRELTQIGPEDICVLVESETKAIKLRKWLVDKSQIIHPFDLNAMIRNYPSEDWNDVQDGKCGVTVDSVSRCAGLHSKVVVLLISRTSIQAKYKEKMYLGSTRACCRLIVIAPEEDKHLFKETFEDVHAMEIDETK